MSKVGRQAATVIPSQRLVISMSPGQTGRKRPSAQGGVARLAEVAVRAVAVSSRPVGRANLQTPNNQINKLMKINFIKLPNKTKEIIISVIFNAGKIFAPKKYPELPHLVEHLIANKLLEDGYTYEAITGIEECAFSIYLTKKKFPEKIINFFEILFENIRFDIQELNTEKKIIKKELLRNFDKLENQIYELAIKNRFTKETPYSNSQYPMIFTDEINLDMINNFYKKHFSLENCLINVGCDCITKNFQKKINSIISNSIFRLGTKKHKMSPPSFSGFKVSQKIQATNSLYLTLNWPSLRVKDSIGSRIALWIVLDYLISNTSSVLYKKLREEGIVYGCNWQNFILEEVGVSSINLSTEKNQVIGCIKIILDEIEKIKQSKIQAKIIEQIKKNFIRDYKLLKQNNYKFFESKSYDAYYNDICSDSKYCSTVKSIKINDLSNISKKIFNYRFLNILMIGPRANISQTNNLVKKYF